MNQTLKTILISAATFAVLLVSVALVVPAQAPDGQLGGDIVNSFKGTVTNDKNALSTTSEVVLAANAGRRYAYFHNTDAAIDITLSFGETAVADEGIVLEPGGFYEIDTSNLYLGAINAIADSGTPTLAIVEK